MICSRSKGLGFFLFFVFNSLGAFRIMLVWESAARLRLPSLTWERKPCPSVAEKSAPGSPGCFFRCDPCALLK